MSIEVMKRIKSLLQDTKMIDSHTISAVVAECDMAILAKQPDTGEPVACATPDGLKSNWHAHHAIVNKAALQMVRNALRNDVERGLKVRGEMLAELDSATFQAHPAPSVPDDVVRDAERLNDLEALVKSKGTHGLSFDYCRHVEDGYVVEKGFRLIWRHTLCERKPTLREAIDDAMLAAKTGGA